ncbi:tetratricopeptide repeat protein [Candidatus Uabimicrobium amorphum]|uniref:Lipopolysaccharide assembly protein B n=1 Tax=Uabimicrobium amorphum TaxID=2596890 RepID=A0A5S9F707_UABAM|nr:tetratricopeptide repeat protein [Candidatus Uabimicrobium amorphum]BBM88208.1 lipopolysaccharide assembly protein B [Candidatus Uabimicrobium amorphum]
MNYRASRLVNKAYLQFEKQNYQQALELLKQAREKDPQSDEVYAYLGEAYIYNELYEEAMQTFDEREKLKTKSAHLDPYIQGYRGRVYLERGDFEEAEKLIDIAMKNNANEPEILITKALIHMYRNQMQQALQVMRKVDFNDPSFYYRKIKTLLKKLSKQKDTSEKNEHES